TDPQKRSRLIDQLLESPAYAAWWATQMSDWTGNSEKQLNNYLPVRGAASKLWFAWLRKRIADNMPYDKIVEGIVTANSRNEGESYSEYCQSMSQACRPGGEEVFAQREGLPHFWSRLNLRKPEEKSIAFAYTFLGIRIQCAQCHKHPFDQWSKQDFDRFTALFQTIQSNGNTIQPTSRKERDAMVKQLVGDEELRGNQLRRRFGEMIRQGETIPFGELLVRLPNNRARRSKNKNKKNKGKMVAPAIPTGNILGVEEPVRLNDDPRQPLMQWLRDPQNPYFAKAIVNRVWANYFGMGIVDPTDDLNLANPPSNAALLDHLATQFIENQFDLRWLHREIANSDTYQRSWKPNATNAADKHNFSHHIPHRLPAEVVHDAVMLATAGDQKSAGARGDALQGRAINVASPSYRGNLNGSQFALTVFGQSIRETQCDCDRSNGSSLLQSVYLRNDADVHRLLSSGDSWVAQMCKENAVAPPTPISRNSNDQAAKNKQRQVENQVQFARKRIAQFHKLDAQRQKRQLPQVKAALTKMHKRLSNLGFAIPDDIELSALTNPPSKRQAKAWDKGLSDDAADSQVKLSVRQLTRSQSQRVVNNAYLQALSRYPDDVEADNSIAFIQSAESPAEGISGLMWALVNTKEFILSH
ncbi:MAG: DUF1553 domain-containing protein, partial [Planctomycetota bacterium]